jgi:hypothetical protein
MRDYVIYNLETGAIVSAVQAPEGQLPPQGPLADGSGLAVRYGKADPDEKRVKWGRIVPQTKTTLRQREIQLAWQSFDAERHRLLNATDWTQVADVPLSDELRQQWRAYRQALRDLPEHTADPANPVWPQAPQKI